jgi:hypothetical protein
VSRTAETAEQIRALLAHELDWDWVQRLAGRHAVLPLLYQQLQATGWETVPQAVRDRLKQHFLRNTSRNLFLTNRLLQLLELFRAHDIPAIPYKGPVLTALAYGHLGLREFCDLDFLIKKEDLSRASRLLLARDYRIPFSLPGTPEATAVRTTGEVPLLHEDGTFVELHATVLRRGFHFPLDLQQAEEPLGRVSLLGKEVRTFSSEQLLLILCAHGAKHVWVSLGWICDLAELIRVHPAMDWAAVLAQARALRSERMLLLGLLLARELLEAAVPEEIVRRAQADGTVRILVDEVSRRLFRESAELPGGWESGLFYVRSRERLGDGIRFALTLAVVPHFADWAHVRLPQSLSFLYYLVRPIRLLGKTGGQLVDRLLGRAAPASESKSVLV